MARHLLITVILPAACLLQTHASCCWLQREHNGKRCARCKCGAHWSDDKRCLDSAGGLRYAVPERQHARAIFAEKHAQQCPQPRLAVRLFPDTNVPRTLQMTQQRTVQRDAEYLTTSIRPEGRDSLPSPRQDLLVICMQWLAMCVRLNVQGTPDLKLTVGPAPGIDLNPALNPGSTASKSGPCFAK